MQRRISTIAILFALIAITLSETSIADERLRLLQTFRQEFVDISPGEGRFGKTAKIGSDALGEKATPIHTVTFDYKFAIAKYEVTQNLWQAVMGNNPSEWKGPRNSVERLSFSEAEQFCEKVTALLRKANLIAADQHVRLPSEAEWEYCCRAGTSTTYSFPAADIDGYAWYTGNAAGNDPPVGAKKPNAWGLYDCHGYLWEWCSDVARENYNDAPADGSAQSKGDKSKRILRGGSWKDSAEKLTSSYRRIAAAKTRDSAVGLRCVLAKVPETESAK